MNHSLLDYRPTIAALEGSPSLDREVAADDQLRQAAELLEQTDAGALRPYLGKLIGRTVPHLHGDLRQSLAGALARIGRPLLRQSGATPRAAAGRVFGLELEGLSPEDQTFELARHFAHFATHAARAADRAKGTGTPRALAARAISVAARRFAPSLYAARASADMPTGAPDHPTSGTWIRRGRQLLVLTP